MSVAVIVGIKKIQNKMVKSINLKILLLIKSPPKVKNISYLKKSDLQQTKKKSRKSKLLFMAGVVGFEPTQAVLETDVLPLTLYP